MNPVTAISSLKKSDVARRSQGAEANRIQPADRIVHDWYRFVLSYPPHLVREYISKFRLGPGACVLDPFCGTGTTLVEALKLGLDTAGVEANPMAFLATRVKVDWCPLPDLLLESSENTANSVLKLLDRDGVPDVHAPLFQPREAVIRLLTLGPEKEQILLKDSISPRPSHKALRLQQALLRAGDERILSHQLLAYAKTLVSSSSNLRFGPEVGVGRPKEDAAVIAPWLENVRTMAADLRMVQGQQHQGQAILRLTDARDLYHKFGPESIDAVITSPPYPNEKDYTRTTRLESVYLGLIQNKQDLRSLKQGLVRSNTRNVYKADTDDSHISENSEIHRIAAEIEERRVQMGKTSGFERLYPRVAMLYFGGMNRHLAGLRTLLRPGAQLAYVVGDQASYLQVMIRTGTLLAEIADSLGYEVTGIDLFRSRFATATREMLREEVVLLRWPGSKRCTSKKVTGPLPADN
jgi:hypothetical protein